jgi:hypothetical protein
VRKSWIRVLIMDGRSSPVNSFIMIWSQLIRCQPMKLMSRSGLTCPIMIDDDLVLIYSPAFQWILEDMLAGLGVKPNHRHALLFFFLSRVLKIVVFSHREWQYSEQESHAHQKLLVVDSRSHEPTGPHLNPPPGAPFLTVCRQIFEVVSEGTQVDVINLKWTRGTRFRLIWALRRVIILRPV